MNQVFDVAIVGSSLSGAIQGYLLSKAGLKVAIIDRSTFPRTKACGEGISTAAFKLMEKVGLFKSLSLVSKYEHNGYQIVQGKDVRTISSHRARPCVYGVSRHDLDNAIVSELSSFSNLSSFYGSSIRRVTDRGDFYELNFDENKITSKYLVLACGAKSNLFSELGISFDKERNEKRFGRTFHLKGDFASAFDKITIFVENDYEVFVTRLSSDSINISFLFSDKLEKLILDKERLGFLLADICKRINFEIINFEDIGASGVCGFQRRTAIFKRGLLIGDSCEQLDPVGGMGMTHAVISSVLASKALIDVLVKSKSEQIAFNRYLREREKYAKLLRGFSRLSFLSLVKYKNLYLLRLLRDSFFTKKINDLVHSINIENDSFMDKNRLTFKLLNTIGKN